MDATELSFRNVTVERAPCLKSNPLLFPPPLKWRPILDVGRRRGDVLVDAEAVECWRLSAGSRRGDSALCWVPVEGS